MTKQDRLKVEVMVRPDLVVNPPGCGLCAIFWGAPMYPTVSPPSAKPTMMDALGRDFLTTKTLSGLGGRGQRGGMVSS